MRNINKCDSDGEPEDDGSEDEEESDGEENDEEDGEDESEEDYEENIGEILNPQLPQFDSDGEIIGDEIIEGTHEDNSDTENSISKILKRKNPLDIEENEENENLEDFENEPKKRKLESTPPKKEKLKPILTEVSEKSESILSSYKQFRTSVIKLDVNAS